MQTLHECDNTEIVIIKHTLLETTYLLRGL